MAKWQVHSCHCCHISVFAISVGRHFLLSKYKLQHSFSHNYIVTIQIPLLYGDTSVESHSPKLEKTFFNFTH